MQDCRDLNSWVVIEVSGGITSVGVSILRTMLGEVLVEALKLNLDPPCIPARSGTSVLHETAGN